MTDRPDFSKMFDASGNALAPVDNLPASPDETLHQMKTMDGPPTTGPATTPGVPAVSPVRDAQGRLVRQDWGPKTTPAVHYEESPRKNWSGLPDWSKPRNEAGQWISTQENQLRETWEKEGGYQAAVVRVQEAESTMLSLSENPEGLQAAIAELPKDIAMKAADVLRLSTGYGQSGGAVKVETFLTSLSDSEFESFRQWWSKLSESDQNALIYGVTR
jgi:hypothetical protein